MTPNASYIIFYFSSSLQDICEKIPKDLPTPNYYPSQFCSIQAGLPIFSFSPTTQFPPSELLVLLPPTTDPARNSKFSTQGLKSKASNEVTIRFSGNLS